MVMKNSQTLFGDSFELFILIIKIDNYIRI
jgi:hypothetical protein